MRETAASITMVRHREESPRCESEDSSVLGPRVRAASPMSPALTTYPMPYSGRTTPSSGVTR